MPRNAIKAGLARWLSQVLATQTWGPELKTQHSCKKPTLVIHTWNPRAGDMEAGGSLRLTGQQTTLSLDCRRRTFYQNPEMILKIDHWPLSCSGGLTHPCTHTPSCIYAHRSLGIHAHAYLQTEKWHVQCASPALMASVLGWGAEGLCLLIPEKQEAKQPTRVGPWSNLDRGILSLFYNPLWHHIMPAGFAFFFLAF